MMVSLCRERGNCTDQWVPLGLSWYGRYWATQRWRQWATGYDGDRWPPTRCTGANDRRWTLRPGPPEDCTRLCWVPSGQQQTGCKFTSEIYGATWLCSWASIQLPVLFQDPCPVFALSHYLFALQALKKKAGDKKELGMRVCRFYLIGVMENWLEFIS